MSEYTTPTSPPLGKTKKDKSRALKPNLNSEKDHETKKFPDPKAYPSFKAHESRPLVLLWAWRTS